MERFQKQLSRLPPPLHPSEKEAHGIGTERPLRVKHLSEANLLHLAGERKRIGRILFLAHAHHAYTVTPGSCQRIHLLRLYALHAAHYMERLHDIDYIQFLLIHGFTIG